MWAFSTASATADVLAGWDFSGVTVGGGSTPLAATTSAANLTVGALTKGSGITASGTLAGNAFGGTGFDAVDAATATTNQDFVTFSVTSSNSYSMSLSEIAAYNIRRSSSGPPSTQWQYQVGSAGTFVNLGAVVLSSGTSSSGNTQPLISLAAIPELQNIASGTTVTFRLVSWGGTSTGSWYLNQFQTGNDLVVNGTLTAPVGTTYTWTGTGGGGTWQDGQQGSFNAAYANSGISVAEFAGTGEAVTVAGAGVEAGQLKFLSSGYTVAGGPLTLGLGTVTTDSATAAAISAPVAGTAGLTKAGDGSLVLSGSNTYTGSTTISAGTLEIATDAALGDVANDLVIGGTLKTTSSIGLAAGRDLSGTGTLDIASGTTLTISGATSMSSLTLSNLGTLAFNNPASNPGNITTTPTSGTVTVNGAIGFSASDKVVSVPTGGALDLTGAITLATASGTELTKEGGGTLVLSGSGSSISRIQLGRSGTTPTAGGTLRVGTAAALGAQEMFFNVGTIEPTAAITTTVGASLAGRAGSEIVIGGPGGSADLTMGAPRLFGPSGTSGDIVLKVNNHTTFTGVMSNSSTSTVSGLTVGGTGRLTLSGASPGMTSPVSLTDSVVLNITGGLGGNVAVGANNVLTGTGTIVGAIGGAGSVQPGASPGILTVGSVNPTAGTDFVLEFTGGLPDYSVATASTNDVVRVTAATPFSAALTSANTLDMFLGVTSLAAGSSFEGGFFTNTAGDFTPSVSDATLNYYVLGDGQGTDATLDGQGFYTFANWKTVSGADPALALSLSTIARTATFATGSVSGQAMVVSAVPEPGTLGLAALAALAASGFAARRRLGELSRP